MSSFNTYDLARRDGWPVLARQLGALLAAETACVDPRDAQPLAEAVAAQLPPVYAAAPELLAACEKVMSVCESSEHWQGETHDALVAVESAIAKAGGTERA